MKLLMKFYLFLMVITMLFALVFYVLLYYLAANVITIVEENWHNPRFQEEKSYTMAANLTADQFIDTVSV